MDVSSKDIARRVIDHPTAHMRVLAPPGSGKTRLLIERFRALEARHGKAAAFPGKTARLPDKTASRDGGESGPSHDKNSSRPGNGSGGIFILTYSADSYKRLTDAVFDRNSARLGPSRVLTYTRLAQEIIESSGGRSPLVVADLEERLILEGVIDRGETRMKSELRSICRSERFLEDVLEACHILLQNDVEGDVLAALEGYASSRIDLRDVILLYKGFRESLESREAATYYDVCWSAVRRLQGRAVDHPLAGATAILVEDFQDIDAGQFELLKSIAPPGGRVALNVFGDPLGSVFAYRGTQHAYLMEEFPRLYGGETYHLSARARRGGVPDATIEALLLETLGERGGEYLPVLSGVSVVWGEKSGGAFSIELPGAALSDETRRAAASIDPGGAFCVERTRDEVDEVYTVAARIAELLRHGKCRAEDIAIVTNNKRSYEPILSAAATQRGIPLDTGRAKKRVLGDFVDALLTLVDSPDDGIAPRSIITSPLFPFLRALFPNPPDTEVSMGPRVMEDLRSFVEGLRSKIRLAPPAEWMRVIRKQCLQPVCAAYWDETRDDTVHQDVGRLLDAWDGYSVAVERWGGQPSVGAFAALDSRLAKRRAPGGAGDVSFLSPREAKGRFFPVVFVLGCSELLFPSAGRSENVLPVSALEDALRGAFPDRPIGVYRARATEKRLSEEHHLLYIALTRSTGELYVTAPRIFAGDEYPAPSAVLERTVPEAAYVETPHEAKTPPQIRFAREWAASAPAPDFPRGLDVLSPAGAQWRSAKPEPGLVRLAPFRISQSSLKTFLECERRFFYRKVLRIPELATPAARVGSLLHEVMAVLGERFPTRAALVTGSTGEVIREVIDDVVQRDKSVGKASFVDRSLRHHLAVMVGKILDLERDEAENRTIVATEQKLEFSRGPWEFTGRIDRVDVTPAGERVILDYKTGKFDKMAKTLRRKTLVALEDPKEANWQVPLYAWGVKATEGSFPRAFTHIVASTREDPFVVTLSIYRGEGDVPEAATKGKGPSYLVESEIEEIMDRAAKVAETIFTPRAHFERTEDLKKCRNCEFRGHCGREGS